MLKNLANFLLVFSFTFTDTKWDGNISCKGTETAPGRCEISSASSLIDFLAYLLHIVKFLFHFFSLDGPIVNNFDLVEMIYIYICVCKHVWHKVTFLYLQQTSYSLQFHIHFLPVFEPLSHYTHTYLLFSFTCLLLFFLQIRRLL